MSTWSKPSPVVTPGEQEGRHDEGGAGEGKTGNGADRMGACASYFTYKFF